jgi:hypothetical protein
MGLGQAHRHLRLLFLHASLLHTTDNNAASPPIHTPLFPPPRPLTHPQLLQLCGVGGIGKTAVAGRVLTRLAEDDWLVAVHEGRWNPPALTAAVTAALDGKAGLTEAQASLIDPQVDDTSKLALVHQLLSRERLLVLFDDFEQNLEAGGGAYHDPGFAEVLDGLCQAARVGRLLVTSRYPLPYDQSLLERIDIPPLSASELRRLLLRLPPYATWSRPTARCWWAPSAAIPA